MVVCLGFNNFQIFEFFGREQYRCLVRSKRGLALADTEAAASYVRSFFVGDRLGDALNLIV